VESFGFNGALIFNELVGVIPKLFLLN